MLMMQWILFVCVCVIVRALKLGALLNTHFAKPFISVCIDAAAAAVLEGIVRDRDAIQLHINTENRK